MRRTMAILAAAAVLATLPLTHAAAMNHGKSAHDHGSKKMDHGGHGHMAGHEEMIMVGTATVEGVKGEAHLNDVREAMKKAGMNATHHFMIAFEDAKSKKAITEGSAALKVSSPDGTTSNPVRLVGMDGHFGADIALEQKGEYTFTVGSKLPDGQSRQFEFRHKVE